jgi:hypothetical protein
MKVIQRILKAFLWSSLEVMQNGKIIIAWSRVQGPLHLGGIGVPDLKLLGIALRA